MAEKNNALWLILIVVAIAIFSGVKLDFIGNGTSFQLLTFVPDQLIESSNEQAFLVRSIREAGYFDLFISKFGLMAITGLEDQYNPNDQLTIETQHYLAECTGNLYLVMDIHNVPYTEQTTNTIYNYFIQWISGGPGGVTNINIKSSMSYTIPSDAEEGVYSLDVYLRCINPEGAIKTSDHDKVSFVVTGTPTCIDSVWSPQLIDVCEGQAFIQTSNCGNERAVMGIKECNTFTCSENNGEICEITELCLDGLLNQGYVESSDTFWCCTTGTCIDAGAIDTEILELTQTLAEKIALIESLHLSLDEQGELVNSLALTLAEKILIVQGLQSEIDNQIVLISQLETTLAEKTQIIQTLTTNIAEQAALIDALTTTSEEQAVLIQALTTNIAEQANLISALQINLQEKADLVSLLQVTNEDQANLISQMELSFVEQGIIIDALNKEVSDDAIIISNLNLNLADQATLITGLELTNLELSTLISNLNLNLADQATLIDNLNLALSDDAQIISNLHLSLVDQANLISQMELTAEEEGVLIANLQLELEEEQILVRELTQTIEEQERIISLIAQAKEEGFELPMLFQEITTPISNIALIGIVSAIGLLGYLWYTKYN